jgi:Domain of unknown function (DUF4402)
MGALPVKRGSSVPSRLRRHALVVFMLGSALCFGGQVAAATKLIPVAAQAVKPLSLASVQDLDLGTILLGPGKWSNAAVGVSRAGAFSCASVNVTCSGVSRAATYTLTGSNSAVVRITAPNVVLTNQSDPSQTLTLIIDNPGTVTIPNSGQKGIDFSLGGSIVVDSNTAGGTYAGTFNVTVDY